MELELFSLLIKNKTFAKLLRSTISLKIQIFWKIPLKTKKLILYEEEPYFSNALNSMAKKNWVLVSTKRLQEEFSFKTIVECTFSKKNVSHWKSEYEIVYSINSVCNGKIVNENSIWIVEACSLNEARSIATKHFANVSGFNIRNIKKVWSY